MRVVKTNTLEFHDESLEYIADQISKMSRKGGVDYVVTPNVDHAARLLTRDRLAQDLIGIYKSASLCLCDSRILRVLMNLKGYGIKHTIPGSTLTEHLFEHTILGSDRILIVGGTVTHIETLRATYPQLNIKHYNPPMGFIQHSAEVNKVLDEVVASDANYIFLALGSPRQEVLANKIYKFVTHASVVMCVGASILFLVGAERRAPLWIQKLHMEWAYRLLQDPHKLGARYIRNFLSLPNIVCKL